MSIEQEMIRIIREIGEDELKIRVAEKKAAETYVDSYKIKYSAEAKSITRSLERKLLLLELIKGRA
jgi:hypothetical protein